VAQSASPNEYLRPTAAQSGDYTIMPTLDLVSVPSSVKKRTRASNECVKITV
jgi:hypothetical protein